MSMCRCWAKWWGKKEPSHLAWREIWHHACSKVLREGNRPTFSCLGHQDDWICPEWYSFLYVLSAQTVMSGSLPVTHILVLMFTVSVQVSKSHCGSSWTTSFFYEVPALLSLWTEFSEMTFEARLLAHVPWAQLYDKTNPQDWVARGSPVPALNRALLPIESIHVQKLI